jgi:ABC-type branched-subunit amino acid transport system ATPase component/ABC-type branched-subunit amino acid transport system permease subunit
VRVLGGVLWVGLVALAFVLPGYQLYVLSLAGVWAIAALGLNILTGYAGLISLGHAGFMAIGAYTSALATLKVGVPPWIALWMGGIVSGVVGVLVGMPALRLHGPYLAIATLGFGAAVQQILLNWDEVTGGYRGLIPPRLVWEGLPVGADAQLYLWTVGGVGLAWGIAALLVSKRPGRAFCAVRDSELAAAACGIDIARSKAEAFAVSAAYAGVAGALYAHLIGFISPYDFGLQISIFLVSAIVIGGLASLPGSILGAVFLTVLFHYMSHLADIRSILYGAALIATVIFLPGGLVRWPWLWRWRRPSPRPSATPLTSPVPSPQAERVRMRSGEGPGVRARVRLLEIAGLTVRFGGLVALDRVDLSLNEGEIVGVIGPNGAGKTTLFNVINRFVEPESGQVRCAGKELLSLPPHHVIELGIARTFQNIELFRNLTVLENVLIGGHRVGGKEQKLRRQAEEILAALGIAHLAPVSAGALPLGAQKMVELARALMSQPRLLLLDEPAAGLTPKEIEGLLGVLRRLHEEHGITLMVVEHHMEFVLKLCERVVVLDFGRVLASGTPAEIIAHPQVVQAYLGAPWGGRS